MGKDAEFDNFAEMAQEFMGGPPLDKGFLKEIWEGADKNLERAINHALSTPDDKVIRAGQGGGSGGGGGESKGKKGKEKEKEKEKKSKKKDKSPAKSEASPPATDFPDFPTNSGFFDSTPSGMSGFDSAVGMGMAGMGGMAPMGPAPGAFGQSPPAQTWGQPQQTLPPQTMPPQGMPPQTMPPPAMQGMPHQTMPPQGMGMPHQTMPPQGMPPQGMPPQSMPPQGMNSMAYQSMPPQSMPPQSMPPQPSFGQSGPGQYDYGQSYGAPEAAKSGFGQASQGFGSSAGYGGPATPSTAAGWESESDSDNDWWNNPAPLQTRGSHGGDALGAAAPQFGTLESASQYPTQMGTGAPGYGAYDMGQGQGHDQWSQQQGGYGGYGDGSQPQGHDQWSQQQGGYGQGNLSQFGSQAQPAGWGY